MIQVGKKAPDFSAPAYAEKPQGNVQGRRAAGKGRAMGDAGQGGEVFLKPRDHGAEGGDVVAGECLLHKFQFPPAHVGRGEIDALLRLH